jgi:altronate dehydratase
VVVAAAAVAAAGLVATGIKLLSFTHRGCLSGSPAISFLELPINSMHVLAF